VRLTGREDLGPALERALAVAADETRTRRHVHGFHSYPARLHPDTAASLIESFSKPGDTILDPFCGSGTIVVEARRLGRLAVGRDLNPLAVALAKLKARGSSERERGNWLAAASAVAEAADERRLARAAPTQLYPKEDLERFEIHVLLELDSLRKAILELPLAGTRRVLLLGLSSLLTKVSRRHGDSGRKSSERRLPAGYAIEAFVKRLDEMTRQLAAYDAVVSRDTPAAQLKKDDARLLSTVEPSSVDLVITSPPYPGVYDYLDHHADRLRWLGMDARGLAEREMGSRRRMNALPRTAVRAHWQTDFDRTLAAVAKTLRKGKLACFVIGDTAVAGEVLRADEIAKAGAKAAGFECVAVASQKRPQFHAESTRTFGGAPRMEHVIVLQRL
jgi:hypothetical protein